MYSKTTVDAALNDAQKYMTLRIQEYGQTAQIPAGWLCLPQVILRSRLDVLGQGWWASWYAAILGRTVADITIQYPDGWWQAFRERWWPAWAKQRWPIRYIVRHISSTQLFPKLPVPEGTQWEYVYSVQDKERRISAASWPNFGEKADE